MKAAKVSPHAQELTDARAASAPSEEEIQSIVSGFIDYIKNTRIRIGLQQQHLEKASGLAKGSLSNIEGRGGSIRLDTLIRLAHGLGTQPSELARLLDRPNLASLTDGRSVGVPIVSQSSVAKETIESTSRELDAVSAKGRKPDALSRSVDAKGSRSKKDRKR